MPCKHAGGSDECRKYDDGRCITERKNKSRKYEASNPEKCADRKKKYFDAQLDCSRLGVGLGADVGHAGELIVRTDLLLKGLQVTVPENRACPDDVHFKSTTGWMSVQVKVVRVNKNTGSWYIPKYKRPITSDIVAWVDVVNRNIRYEANVKEVPPELLT